LTLHLHALNKQDTAFQRWLALYFLMEECVVLAFAVAICIEAASRQKGGGGQGTDGQRGQQQQS
jgi:hypothetical protein